MSSGVGHDVTPNTTPKDDSEPYPYYSLTKARPKPRFNPYRDVLLRDFVLCLPYDKHSLHMCLAHAISTIELSAGSNYETFFVEWWTPMCSKKEPKSLVARKCWIRRWTPEVTHPQRITVTTVLYSHKMSTHKDKKPSKMHLIPKALAVMELANLAASGAFDEDEVGTDLED